MINHILTFLQSLSFQRFGKYVPVYSKMKLFLTLQGVTDSFVGSITNIRFNDKEINEQPVTTNAIPLSDITEVGSYFYGDGGYIKLGKSCILLY